MKILFVAHRAPYPPDSGSKIRSFNMIRHLSETGHEVTVASLARSEQELEQVNGLREFCSDLIIETVSNPASWLRSVARLPGRTPSSMGYFFSPALARRIRNVTNTGNFDFIVVHSSSVAQYVEHCTDTPMLLDFCDMDSQKWLGYVGWKPFPFNLGYNIEGRKLERDEKRLAALFDVCTVATPLELETLNSFGTARDTDWFANGVDTGFFSRTRPYQPTGPLCFVGRMDYYPNEQAIIDFCDDCWPALRAAKPDLELTIVGANPTKAVSRLQELPGVTVTGYVDDVRPWLEQASIAIAPLKIARGTQNKVLEAMAMELPVICSAVAAGGVDVVSGEDLVVADNVQQMVTAVMQLLDNPEQMSQMGARARTRVTDHHSWQRSMTKLSNIIDRTAGRRQASSG